jgi:N-acylneuraminate cytidylyltransferase
LEEKNGKLETALKKKNKQFYRRQDAPIFFDLTTVCYVLKPSYINKNNNLFSGKIGFIKVPKNRALDIDDIWDYKIAKCLSRS